MNTARAAVGWIGAALMAGGYFFSVKQALDPEADTGKYVQALDGSSVPWLALGLLVAAVIFAIVPSQPDTEEEQP
jgi:hypothetical protein